MTKPLVIFHADCQDGYGAAFAAWMKLGDEAEYVPMNYGEVKAPVNLIGMFGDTFKGRDVYVLDFSFQKEVMDWLFANAKRVVWLDHHKTAFEMWCEKIPTSGIVWQKFNDARHHVHLNNYKSGAMLAWEFFHPGTEVPMLIQHIDDRDRWQWKMEGSAEIHAALGAMQPWSFEQWQDIFELASDRGMLDLYTEGAAILRAQKQHVERMAKQARKCSIPYSTVPTPMPVAVGLAVNAPIHQSEVGHELANASGTFGLIWYLGSDGRVRCSLRSNGDYDVSSIARCFGGGGHRNAAGFETDIETLMSWLT